MSNIVEYILNLKDNLSGKLNEANSHAKRLESTVQGVKSSLSSLGSALGITAGIAGVVAATKSMVTAGTTVENAITGLTTLTKSSATAMSVVQNTMKDAMETPYSFESLLAANKALIAADESAEGAREAVYNLANAISATGGGNDELTRMVVNLQQIKNNGFATALDIRQFAYAGVNIHKALHEAGVKTGEGIKITYEQITNALKIAHDQGGIYYHGLENMAKNTSIKISNMGDAAFQFGVKIFNDLKPVIDFVVDGITNMIGKLSVMWGKLGEWFKQNKETVSMIKNSIIGIVEPVVDFIKRITTDTKGWGDYLATIKDLFVSSIYPLFQKVQSAVINIATKLWDFIQHSYLLKDTFTFIANIVKGIGWVIGKLIDGLVWTFNNVIMPILNAIEKVHRFISGRPLVDEDIKNLSSVKVAEETKKNGVIPEVGKKIIPTTKNGLSDTTAAPKTKAEGQKTINIHVAYNAPLIKDFSINTTNVKEGFGSLKEQLTAILTGATHDSLIVADA